MAERRYTRVRRLARENAAAAAGALIGLLSISWLSLYDFAWNDYDNEASGSVYALVHGHLLDFLLRAPPYGGSLLLRAPFALAPDLWGGGELADYRMLALPCLLAAGALGVWLAAWMRAAGAGRLARVTLLGLLVANPAMVFALQIGHPEEILGAVLCVAAILVARSGASVATGLLLGLAVANKSWALVAVAPVIFGVADRRGRALVIAGVVTVIVYSPFVAVARLHHSGADTGTIFQPQQLWWFLGESHRTVYGSFGRLMVGYRAAPQWLSSLTHPLILVTGLPLTLLWRRRTIGRRDEPIALLALLLALRCLLDPLNNYYYALPLLFALAVWEVRARREPPLGALAASALTWLCFQGPVGHLSPDARAVVYLVCALPSVAALVLWLYAPARWGRIAGAAGRLAPRWPAGTPAALAPTQRG